MQASNERPAADEERDLGTAAKLLYRQGETDIVQLLLATKSATYEWINDNWGVDYYTLVLEVDVDLFDDFDERVVEALATALSRTTRARGYQVSTVEIAPTPVTGDWRADMGAALRGTPINQATLVALPPKHPIVDGMHFRDDDEVRVYEGLKRAQETLPKHDSIAIAVNPSLRVAGRTWEPDFLVTYRGRCGAIEVDGGSHRKKWASDKSRDDLLTDAGVARVQRIDVADAKNPATVDQFVHAFLNRILS